MKIIVFNKGKIKEKRILNMNNYAINLFEIWKRYEDIKIEITSHELKQYLADIYELYESKNIIKHYQDDVKIYLASIIKQTKQNDYIITVNHLYDSLVCPLYEKRNDNINKSKTKDKIKIISKDDKNG